MKFKKLFFIIVFYASNMLQAAVIDTVQTYSKSMNKQIKAIVVTPDNYLKGKEIPVVYLLHGFSGNYKDYITKCKNIEKFADIYNLIIVCPDGGFSSWYFDSPIDSKMKYETYISSELVSFIDKNYKTIKNPKGRAITGLSMGGHGALYLALRHQDVFGAAGSMSGGVDIRPFSDNWDLPLQLGKYSEFPENWEKNTVFNLLYLLKPNGLSLIIDCGTEDFFYEVNKNLHEQLIHQNIPHDFISRPGSHNWEYWTNSVKFQLLFFNNFFIKN
jgi:S-formylglutathione hydrolase FrmB